MIIIRTGRRRIHVIWDRDPINNDTLDPSKELSTYSECHRKVSTARRFMRLKGYDKYQPRYNYVHISCRRFRGKPNRTWSDRCNYIDYHSNISDKYYGYVPYDKLHRIEQRRYVDRLNGLTIDFYDYFRVYSRFIPFVPFMSFAPRMYKDIRYNIRIAYKDDYTLTKDDVSRVNIHTYVY